MQKPVKTLASSALLALIIPSFSQAADSLRYQVEVRGHLRDSEQAKFPTLFPFPPSHLPVGDTSAFLETVDEGQHAEISLISLSGLWDINDKLSFQFKLDAIDKYDRNPTSGDRKFDVDSAFLRYGDHFAATKIPDSPGFYAQIGKFKKFEQQRERRTESYGVVSTAFNRFEDSGIEAGFDLPNGLYGKLSWTTGNPVFMRDPNALAGDNGTNDRRVPPENPDPRLKSGIVMLYDAEIEDFDLGDTPEIGAALGYRWLSADGQQSLDLMAFGYERDIEEGVSLHGTFYGADIDLFDLGEVPGAAGIRLPYSGNDKTEKGMNIWYYNGNFSLFGQYVDQEIADLDRDGYEIELSYVIETPITLTPVIRYSELNNDFEGTPQYPAPSVWWDWKRIDYGLNADITDNLRLILEYADNRFLRNGRWESNDEILLTLRWQWGGSF